MPSPCLRVSVVNVPPWGLRIPMPARVALYSNYRHFTDPVSDAVRAETFGVDIGQNSCTTVDEYELFSAWLEIGAYHQVLEVARGSGGPALHLVSATGCCVTGI